MDIITLINELVSGLLNVKQHKERCGDCAVAADYNLHIERITLTACSKKQRAFFLLTTQKVV